MTKLNLLLLFLMVVTACRRETAPGTLDISQQWLFSPDTAGIGEQKQWYVVDYNDSDWITIDAGRRWEEQGFPTLDGDAWYRKNVKVPASWKSKKVWIKFGGVNDAYDLYVNGKQVSSFGAAHVSFAGKPSFAEVDSFLRPGESNLIALRVNDWGNSGGLWRLPVILTTDAQETRLFQPLNEKPFVPEKEGYHLVWEDNFDGTSLDTTKWSVRGIGPRGAGYVSPDAVKVENGYLKLYALMDHDSLKVGIVGTQGHYETHYGYFECRAQLQHSSGNWAAFWIQSPGISRGEDPARYGTEIDIFEYFKDQGGEFLSHNLHWAYGPHQKSSGPFLSKVKGLGEGFHTFALEWTPEKYAFFIDGMKYHEVKIAISHIDEYVILSMEPARNTEDLRKAVMPDVFTVDYVKIYKKK